MSERLLHDVSNSLDAATTALAHPTTTARMRSTHTLSILPRLGNNDPVYTRIDNGQMRKRFNWRFVGVGVAVLFCVVWALGPRARRERVFDVVNPYPRPVPPSEFDLDNMPRPPTPPTPPKPVHDDTVPPAPPTPPTPPSTPLTFQTDPDPTKTVHCTAPHSPSSPLVQWALMIDAGSTGSRIHIYKFHNCRPAPEYEYEVFKMTQPGLSKFAGDPDGAARSLDPLLEEALATVPEALRGCTPVAVKATAGLRLLGAGQSAEILAAVRGRLVAKYPFSVVKKDGVAIMEGKDEGVYAWMTANYLLNTIRTGGESSYAVLDLGGASTQIVFEPTFSKPDATLEDGEHKYRLEFSGRQHVLYQHSYLGYGLMSARKSVHRLVDFMHSPGGHDAREIANPCLAQGTTREVEVEDAAGTRKVTMTGADVGSFEACNRIVELVMAKNAICHVKPCSFNGVYQPSLLDTFPTGKILLLSYFYDRLSPLLPAGDLTLPVSTFATFAERVCRGAPSWREHWGNNPEAMAELEDRPEHCLDLTFMHALLRLGYEFGTDREVRMAKKVDDTELGWCLGATIALLDGTLECTA
ncbi:hypothetical protein K439DRAFT_1393144 [Ramaria rubella]|nr:hypothetical protein K439DRAFT_1393144 [Ramaria rubella]